MLNHTISLNDYFVNSTQTPVKCNILNPSLFEVSASRIAYYLFPKNFAKYTFILQHKDADKNNVNAGYFFDSYLIEHCTDYNALDGIENVYATAFYLGLEIRSHLCIKENDKQYLYIDDLSHAFHKVSAKCERVSSEYRDHKIFPLEKGTLFPTAFMGTDCGVWLNATCNTTRLENAYLKIMNASQKEIDSMIDIAMDALKAIECPDNDCSFIEHYKYMDNVKAILSHNQQAISELYERYKNGTSLSDTERKTCDEDEYPTDYDPDL